MESLATEPQYKKFVGRCVRSFYRPPCLCVLHFVLFLKSGSNAGEAHTNSQVVSSRRLFVLDRCSTGQLRSRTLLPSTLSSQGANPPFQPRLHHNALLLPPSQACRSAQHASTYLSIVRSYAFTEALRLVLFTVGTSVALYVSRSLSFLCRMPCNFRQCKNLSSPHLNSSFDGSPPAAAGGAAAADAADAVTAATLPLCESTSLVTAKASAPSTRPSRFPAWYMMMVGTATISFSSETSGCSSASLLKCQCVTSQNMDVGTSAYCTNHARAECSNR